MWEYDVRRGLIRSHTNLALIIAAGSNEYVDVENEVRFNARNGLLLVITAGSNA